MDPNATLQEIREIVAADTTADLWRLAELIEALDEWITHGGFLPTDWSKQP